MRKHILICAAALIVGPLAMAELSKTTGKSAEETKKMDVDNSGINKRDVSKDGENRRLTPDDQSRGSKGDVELTRQIRAELMKDSSLSVYAQNIKIITLNGVVHLRGPVSTQAEKERIATMAKKLAGTEAVTNEIEVKAKK